MKTVRNTARLFRKEAIRHSFDYPESAENSSEAEKGFENRDVEDGSIFQVVVSVERREPCKPESERDAKDGFQPYLVHGFTKKFLGIQSRHDAEKTEQRKNGPADDGATQDDDAFTNGRFGEGPMLVHGRLRKRLQKHNRLGCRRRCSGWPGRGVSLVTLMADCFRLL